MHSSPTLKSRASAGVLALLLLVLSVSGSNLADDYVGKSFSVSVLLLIVTSGMPFVMRVFHRTPGASLIRIREGDAQAYGLFGGVVVVPDSWLKDLSAAGRRALLAHERTHLAQAHYLLFFVVVGLVYGLPRPLAVSTLVGTLWFFEFVADYSAARVVNAQAVVEVLEVAATQNSIPRWLPWFSHPPIALRIYILRRFQ